MPGFRNRSPTRRVSHWEVHNSPGRRSAFPSLAMSVLDPKTSIAHLIASPTLMIDPELPSFSGRFMSPPQIEVLVRECYLDTHGRYIG